jgi:hypothetical protein
MEKFNMLGILKAGKPRKPNQNWELMEIIGSTGNNTHKEEPTSVCKRGVK